MVGNEKSNSNTHSDIESESNLAIAHNLADPASPVLAKIALDQGNNFEKIISLDKNVNESSALLKPANSSQIASALTSRLVNDLVSGLLAGRIEHEIRPSAQLLITELSSRLSLRELELLKQGLLQTRRLPHDKSIQGVITALLKKCFDELRPSGNTPSKFISDSSALEFTVRKGNQELLYEDDSNSQARLLGILRDFGLELAVFLDRSEADGISDLQDLLAGCQFKFQERARQMRLTSQQVRLGEIFLLQVSTAIFFDKLELVLHDYLASGTNYSLVSGKVWASRYRRSDYMPFFYDSIPSLQKQRSWLFADPNTIAKIASAQVQVKAASLRADRKLEYIVAGQKKSLESILLEMRAFFGIGLNSLIRNHGELALRFFERVLTCSADAIEHPEQKTAILSQRLSRLRVQAYLSHAQAEILDADSKLKRTSEKDRSKIAKSIFEKKILSIRSSMSKVKYELELLGLSGLTIEINGTRHASLEGLSEWVAQFINREEALLRYDLSCSLEMHREAHSALCSYLALLLGFESWEGDRFLELHGKVRVNLKTGAESGSFWRSKELRCHDERFVQEICERVEALESGPRERFIAVIPLMISSCLEFEDFDLGFGLAVAHRHLFGQIISLTPCAPDFELLFGMIDAEVRFEFGLFKGESKSAQESALSVLAQNREKEFKGFFREIDRKREFRLMQAVDDLSRVEALRDFSDFMELQILREGIQGQFVSQEIRILTAVARSTKKKSMAKELCSLVSLRVDQRLKLSAESVKRFLSLNYEKRDVKELTRVESYLWELDLESRALAAVQVLLDASLSCAILQDEKCSRDLLRVTLELYSAVFPGLVKLIDSILAAQSLEEFRRRVEHTILILEEQALSGELSLMGASSGAGLGFVLSHGNISGFFELFQRFSLISSVARRRVVPGRCKPLQRYAISHRWARLQQRVLSSVVALNDGLTCT